MMNPSNAKVWIGVVEVRPKPGVEVFESAFDPTNVGAFATALVMALDETDSKTKLQNKLDLLGLDLIDFTEIDLLSERTKQYSVDREVLALADQLDEANPVGLDEFAVFPLDEE
jgi:predicted GTPase